MLSPNPLRRTLSTVLVLATLTCAQVSHAILVTGSFDGTVTSGRTYVSSTFGNYQNLYGRAVTGTFHYESEPTGVNGYAYNNQRQYASSTNSWLTINVSIDGVAVPITTTTGNPYERITTYNTASHDRLDLFDRNGYYSSSCYYGCYSRYYRYDQFSLTLHDYTGTSLSSGAIPTMFNASSGFGYVRVTNHRSSRCYYYCSGPSHYNESLYANFSINNVRFNTAAVPEPGTLSLLALGLVGLGLARRRQGH